MVDALKLRVAATTNLTDRIKMFELESVEGSLPEFQPGAHIQLNTGNNTFRHYSLTNDPSERHRYVIAVLRELQGVGSAWMHDSVAPGAVLTANGPRNGFELEESADEYLLLAGGIGITPLRSMAFRLRARVARFRLIYCTRSREESSFYCDLREQFVDAVHFHHDGGELSNLLDVKSLLAERSANAHLYICGPPKLIESARAAASHWPMNAVHSESFGSPAVSRPPPVATTCNEAFEVEFKRSGKVITVRPDETILDAMLAAGVNAPHVCKEGWCGNCQLPLLGGNADHRDEVLTDEQKAANAVIHVCISRAAIGETRLVIDR